MTFAEKIKKLRNDNQLTQEQLAEKIYVTRTAVSKWETGNGYPGIDSLKQLAELFQISIDDLISDDDMENKKLLEDKIARRMYYIAVAFFGITVIFVLLAYFFKMPHLNIISSCGAILYLVFGFLSKPKYKRIQARKKIIPYILSKAIVFVIVAGVIIYMIVTI